MVLDDEGWAEMTKLLASVLAETEKIEARSTSRLKKAGEEARDTHDLRPDALRVAAARSLLSLHAQEC